MISRITSEKNFLLYFLFTCMVAVLGQSLFFGSNFKLFYTLYVPIYFFSFSQYAAFYLYLHRLVNGKISSAQIIYHHLLPVLVALIISYFYYFRHTRQESYSILSSYLNENIPTNKKIKLTYFVDISMRNLFLVVGFLYSYFIQIRIKKHQNKLKNYFSETALYKLTWVKVFNIILIVFTLWGGILFNLKGNFFINPENKWVAIFPCVILSALFWLIAYFGNKQVAIPVEFIEFNYTSSIGIKD